MPKRAKTTNPARTISEPTPTPNPTEITQNKEKPTTQTQTQTALEESVVFEHKLPLVKGLVYSTDGIFSGISNWFHSRDIFREITDIAVLAGGAMLWEVDPQHPVTNDIDLFVLNNDVVELKKLINLISEYYNVGTFQRIGHTVFNLRVNSKLLFQIILTDYKDVDDVINHFDLSYVKVATHKGKNYIMPSCQKTIETRLIPTIPKTKDKVKRVIKATKKGFHFPDEEMTDYLKDLIESYVPYEPYIEECTLAGVICTKNSEFQPLRAIDYNRANDSEYFSYQLNDQTKYKSHSMIECSYFRFKLPYLNHKYRESCIKLKINVKYLNHFTGGEQGASMLVKLNNIDPVADKIMDAVRTNLVKCRYYDSNIVPEDLAKLKQGGYYLIQAHISKTIMKHDPKKIHQTIQLEKVLREITEADFKRPYY